MELTKWKIDKFSQETISLNGAGNRILSLQKNGDSIIFQEECDDCFSVEMSKEDAKKALLEAIEWIDNN